MHSFEPAIRLGLPTYPFADLERRVTAMKKAGEPIYDLSIGDPDLPPPPFVEKALRDALEEPNYHRYPTSRGSSEARKSVANWFRGRFGVELDPDSQVCILIGAKEGLANIARAVVNPGDLVAVPDPAYPVYARAGCHLVEGKLKTLDLRVDRGFLPDLTEASGARLLYLNYPNNPTGATASDQFLLDVAEFAEAHPETTIAYDMAYSEVKFDHPARSLLEFTPCAVEFHSLSKMANATGYRVGFAVGDPDRISALIKTKEEMDSGAPLPCQRALAAMLDRYDNCNPPIEIVRAKEIYRHRKQRVARALEHIDLEVFRSSATFYVWARVGKDEMPFIDRALDLGIVLTPGSAFGKNGVGWIRASVTAPDDVIDGAVRLLTEIEQ